MLLYTFSYSSTSPLPLYSSQKISLTQNEPQTKHRQEFLLYILGKSFLRNLNLPFKD